MVVPWAPAVAFVFIWEGLIGVYFWSIQYFVCCSDDDSDDESDEKNENGDDSNNLVDSKKLEKCTMRVEEDEDVVEVYLGVALRLMVKRVANKEAEKAEKKVFADAEAAFEQIENEL